MHIGALGFVYRNTKEPITEIKAVVKENHNNSLSSHFFFLLVLFGNWHQPVRFVVNDRGLFTAGWFGVREI